MAHVCHKTYKTKMTEETKGGSETLEYTSLKFIMEDDPPELPYARLGVRALAACVVPRIIEVPAKGISMGGIVVEEFLGGKWCQPICAYRTEVKFGQHLKIGDEAKIDIVLPFDKTNSRWRIRATCRQRQLEAEIDLAKVNYVDPPNHDANLVEHIVLRSRI